MEMLLTQNGYYRILYAPGGALTPDASDRFRKAAAAGGELLYGDETVTEAGRKERLLKKPNWSPDTLRSFPYIGSPVAVSQALWNAARCGESDGPDERYRNLLRMASLTDSVMHIPAVLFRGPALPPANPVGAVAAQLRREQVKASVVRGLLPGTAAVRYVVPRGTRISCIVYGSGGMEPFRRTLESVTCRNTYLPVELLVADGCHPDEATECYMAALQKNRVARVIRRYGETNLARLCNMAVEQAAGEAVLFLPAGTGIKTHNGFVRMLEYALLPHTGAIFGLSDGAEANAEPHRQIIRNVSLAEPPLMIRRDRFLCAGGFDETLGRTGFSEALCWRLIHRRLHNVATPYAVFQKPMSAQPWLLSARNEQRIKDLQFQWEREREARRLVWN